MATKPSWPALAKLGNHEEIALLVCCAVERCCDADLPQRLIELQRDIFDIFGVRATTDRLEHWRQSVFAELATAISKLTNRELEALLQELHIDLDPSVMLPTEQALACQPYARWKHLVPVIESIADGICQPTSENAERLIEAVNLYMKRVGRITNRQLKQIRSRARRERQQIVREPSTDSLVVK